ncbi:helix-turn-helix domain-containing protein [Actinomadura rudentiformis]|uniref:helix-turn-helix domain-containing protein n=1 Tax=Actinomadura rudentiformis TaxID=359158 RepID=UPI00178C282A|nr:helix-turn-helix domain-containing protein [Actinomadura rudentiformis]
MVVSSLRASEPAYRHGGIPPQEPPLWIGRSIDLALDAFRMSPEERIGTLDWPRRLGERRARQGVPMQALLRAYHIGGKVICDAFTQWGFEEGLAPAHSISLIDDAWDVVDRHSSAALEALRTTEAELPGRQVTAALLDALLNGETDRATAAVVARAFALPEEGRYAVVVQRPADGPAAPLDPMELPVRVHGVRMIWRMHGESAIGVAVLGELSAAALGAALPTRGGRRTGVSVAVEGLTELGRARQLAELAARTLSNGHGLATLDDRLSATMLTVRPDLARELELRVLAPVLALDQPSRDLLLDTLAAWLEAEGSATRAAESLYCHRNTVLNRLRRLELLTKRSLDNPKDLVEVTLALEAFNLRSGSRR